MTRNWFGVPGPGDGDADGLGRLGAGACRPGRRRGRPRQSPEAHLAQALDGEERGHGARGHHVPRGDAAHHLRERERERREKGESERE